MRVQKYSCKYDRKTIGQITKVIPCGDRKYIQKTVAGLIEWEWSEERISVLVVAKLLSHVQPFATPWAETRQATLSVLSSQLNLTL